MMRFFRHRPAAEQMEAAETPTSLPKPLQSRNPRLLLTAQLVLDLASDEQHAVPKAVADWARLATGVEVDE